MERRSRSPKSPLTALSDKLEALAEAYPDEDVELLLEFVDAIDAWVREDLLSRLGRRADRESFADGVFRAWHKLTSRTKSDIAKLASDEDCRGDLEALVGNLADGG